MGGASTTTANRGWRERDETIRNGGRGAPRFFLKKYSYSLMNRSVKTSAKNPRATFALLKVTTQRQAVTATGAWQEGATQTEQGQRWRQGDTFSYRLQAPTGRGKHLTELLRPLRVSPCRCQ